MSDRPTGRTIGRYALLGTIGSGGMANVHLGRLRGPAGFARNVAIKRLLPELANDTTFVTMFLDEARTSARIQHPNVVATLDALSVDGELFLVMEYVHGESLAQLLANVARRGERVPLDIAAAILVGALRGLHAAHEAKDENGAPLELVHRDLSPHNILVGDSGTAHVLDFGVAKTRGRQQVSRVGVLKGKVAYMAPEQVHGNVSRRSDIFSMGVVFWQVLTGERLFQGETEGEILAAVMLAKAPPPSTKNPLVPSALDEVVLKSLSRSPEARYASAHELAEAIEQSVAVATPGAVAAWLRREAGAALDARERMLHGEVPAGDATSRPRWRTVSVAAGALAALLVALAIGHAWRRPEASAAPPEAAQAPAPPPAADPSLELGPEPPAPGDQTTAAKSPRRKPRAASNCNPPYTVDDKGRKFFKRECF